MSQGSFSLGYVDISVHTAENMGGMLVVSST